MCFHFADLRMESVKDSTTSYVRNFVGSLSRKKSVDISQLKDTKLRRCLNVVDLTSLGKYKMKIAHNHVKKCVHFCQMDKAE